VGQKWPTGQGSAVVVVHLDPDGQTSHTLAWELQSSLKITKERKEKKKRKESKKKKGKRRKGK
jgi:hypothetical protein